MSRARSRPTPGRRGRSRSAFRESLDAIFRPRSVAVIGASRRKQTIGREILHNLVDFEFTGPVYPVNAFADVVHIDEELCEALGDSRTGGSRRGHGSTQPYARSRRAVRQERRSRVGDDHRGVQGGRRGGGKSSRRRSPSGSTSTSMRMVGPNCMGVINTEETIRLNATFAATLPERGNVGFVSQSGALGEAILADAAESGLGVAMFASMGNKTDISGNDLIEYWEDNPDIGAILMYLESFGNPHRFTQMARRVTRKKPIITVKAGRTAAGARAASSHTGSIVGLDIATDSLLEQCGVLRVSSMAELFVQASALANQPVPTGDRVAIVTNAGGPGILCTDSLIGRGVRMAELRPATRRALEKALPAEATVANPVDMIASADADRYRAVLKHVRQDPGVDAVIAIFVSPIMIDAYEVARAIADSADRSKPFLSVFMGKVRSDEGIEELRKRRVPVYRFPEEAASAMAAMVRYRRLRARLRWGRQSVSGCGARWPRGLSRPRRKDGRDQLSPHEVRTVLDAYGLPLVPSRTVDSAAEAIAAAIELDYPVVLKVASQKILHKTDLAGVKVDLRNADEVGRVYGDLTSRLKKHDADLKVSVQKMVRGGKEVILGMTRDPQFGPLLAFGLGGVFVEVLRDVEVRVPPLTDVDARSMIEGVRGVPVAFGRARGEPPVDLAFVGECLQRLSQLVTDFERDIHELDINPLIATETARDSFVVDARIALVGSPGQPGVSV